MELEYFENVWKEQNKNREAVEKFWDNRANEFNSRVHDEKNKTKDVTKFLINNDMLDGNSEVLDIGCGPGKYSIEFAKRCKNVIGLDVSEKMLQNARNNAVEQGIRNTEFIKSFWDRLDLKENGWKNKFNLVFASMCPGINSMETLEKMIKASKGSCFMSGFVSRKDYVWDKLNKHLGRQHITKERNKKIYYSFNILWLKGYYPQIRYIDNDWDRTWTLEYIYDLYINRLQMEENLTEKEKNEIYKFLQGCSRNGYVKETISSKVAWLYWDI